MDAEVGCLDLKPFVISGITTNVNSTLERVLCVSDKKYMIIMEIRINSSKHPKKFLCLCPAQFPLERTDFGTTYFTF